MTGGVGPGNIRENIKRVRGNLCQAALRAGRDPGDVKLVAVSKTVTPVLIQEALAEGICCLGENRVQELLAKKTMIDSPAEWHLVGHLQRNKVRSLLPEVSLIHSLDSPSLAQVIQRRAEEQGCTVDVLVEVNVAGEATKYGLRPDETPAFIASLASLSRLRVRGLMTVAPLTGESEGVRRVFGRLRDLLDESRTGGANWPWFKELSMGMSQDYEVAVEEGATIVRIGSAIFGYREEKRWAD